MASRGRGRGKWFKRSGGGRSGRSDQHHAKCKVHQKKKGEKNGNGN